MEKSNKQSVYLKNTPSLETILTRWWQSMMLSSEELKNHNIAPASSGAKAQLKRCTSVDAAVLSEGFRALWQSMSLEVTEQFSPADFERWATIAAILVHVQKDSDIKLAVAAGRHGDGDKSVVSEMRFAQLQSAKNADEFLRRLRRILKQVKGEVSIIRLAKDIEQWFIEQHSFRPRKAENRISVQWAMDYYWAAGKTAK